MGRDEDPWWGVDAALGAAAIVARTAGGVADSVGGTTAARALGGTARWLTRPLAREGGEVRERIEQEAGPAAQQAIRQATRGFVGAIAIDQVLAAIDVNARRPVEVRRHGDQDLAERRGPGRDPGRAARRRRLRHRSR